jgi:hypothetical protein
MGCCFLTMLWKLAVKGTGFVVSSLYRMWFRKFVRNVLNVDVLCLTFLGVERSQVMTVDGENGLVDGEDSPSDGVDLPAEVVEARQARRAVRFSRTSVQVAVELSRREREYLFKKYGIYGW